MPVTRRPYRTAGMREGKHPEPPLEASRRFNQRTPWRVGYAQQGYTEDKPGTWNLRDASGNLIAQRHVTTAAARQTAKRTGTPALRFRPR